MPAAALAWPAPRHARRVVLLEGCVQPTLGAPINPAAARVLDRLGISALRVRGAGCCGAVAHHLGAEADTRRQLRSNIDALWGAVEAGVEAIIETSSACTAMLGEYGRLLQDDPRYAQRAARVSALARDLSAVLAGEGTTLGAALARAAAAAPGRRRAHEGGLPGTLQPAARTEGDAAWSSRCCAPPGMR